ncbi:Phosphatidylinositol_4-phosphate 5-kinase 6 [Hexamita inflata]|uniref:Phosphatidylinositol 4-phosphate 5-kinase 6 n=1 Tax=Hexamita inflata TaxID=28002 RepID=A0AA86TFE3_9EUKA|nr:Phosphatidylinositol 4-phosphate 5-kinase 6 [Hexamita inflata]
MIGVMQKNCQPNKSSMRTKKEFVDKYGSKYSGQWQNSDYKNGQGTIHLSNGNVYTGKWVNDIFEGDALYEFANGNEYKGCFKNGLKHGYGIFTHQNGCVQKGHWQNGTLHHDYQIEYPNWSVLESYDSRYAVMTFSNGDSCKIMNSSPSFKVTKLLRDIGSLDLDMLSESDLDCLEDIIFMQ